MIYFNYDKFTVTDILYYYLLSDDLLKYIYMFTTFHLLNIDIYVDNA